MMDSDGEPSLDSKQVLADALFMVGQLLEKTWASKNDRRLFLALDWAKCFDSFLPCGLLSTLKRFGMPEDFVTMFSATYSLRWFFVKECGSTSSVRMQHSGVSQRYPLPLYLFIIVMSVLGSR